jgi:ferrous iron transport protein A
MIAPGIQETVLPLDLLQANEEASVVDLIGDDAQIHRLAEMGLRVGAVVRMVRPGSPCLLALNGKRLSVRLSGEIDVLVASAHA